MWDKGETDPRQARPCALKGWRKGNPTHGWILGKDRLGRRGGDCHQKGGWEPSCSLKLGSPLGECRASRHPQAKAQEKKEFIIIFSK